MKHSFASILFIMPLVCACLFSAASARAGEDKPAADSVAEEQAPAEDKSKDRLAVSFDIFAATKQAQFRSTADSILTWRDLHFVGIALGAEKNGWGGKIFFAGAAGGYATDDDLDNGYYAVSNYSVDAGYYGFDVYKPANFHDKVKARWGFEFSRMELDGYPKTAIFPNDTRTGGDIIIIGEDQTWLAEKYNFNNLAVYIGADVAVYKGGRQTVALDAAVGAGILYGELDWRNYRGKTAMTMDSLAYPLLSFKVGIRYEWAFANRAALVLSAAYKNEYLFGGDYTIQRIYKKNMPPDDSRYDAPASKLVNFFKDAGASELQLRLGFMGAL